MQISIASGKGGTGKTTVAVNLFISLCRSVSTENRLAQKGFNGVIQFLDCDVEEPNAHIFLKPTITERLAVNVKVPVVDESKCVHCGVCSRVCQFNAIVVTRLKTLFIPELCHCCGACSLFCPEKAIVEGSKEIGVVETGKADGGLFSRGILNIGESRAEPLITGVRATAERGGIVIVDASPGTSCSMVQTVRGTDLCILVTEPTLFGLHDLELAWEVARKLGVPSAVVINRSDVGDDRVENFCRDKGLEVLLRIPFDMRIARSYAAGFTLVEQFPEYEALFAEFAQRVIDRINRN